MKKRLLICCALILFNAPSFTQTHYSNSPREIELHRIENLKAGLNGDEGVYNRLTFTFEDFALFEKHFSEIETMLPSSLSIQKIVILNGEQKCEVIYALPAAKTDDFLKEFKETIGKFGVLMYNYQEEVIIISSN
jgi:hypothetical protein